MAHAKLRLRNIDMFPPRILYRVSRENDYNYSNMNSTAAVIIFSAHPVQFQKLQSIRSQSHERVGRKKISVGTAVVFH